jgi:hypothetical protein
MIAAIHQPNFIPWLGFFSKIKAADIFILYDTCQYSKNSFINRNKILSGGEERWLTIPVKYKGYSDSNIADIRIDEQQYRPDKIVRTLLQDYRESHFLTRYIDQFFNILKSAQDHYMLSQLNEEVIHWVCTILQINTPIIRASDLSLPKQNGTIGLLALCQACDATVYLSGNSGKKYLKEELFEKEGLAVKYFECPALISTYGYLSCLHWLFTKGNNLMLDSDI